MKPFSRPKAKRDEVLRMLTTALGYVPNEPVYLVGIRGYYRDTMGKVGENDRGIYDDAIYLISPNKTLSFNANTDPSKYTPGVAKLICGIHRYRPGKHGLSKPKTAYPAFRPATPDESLPVTRDGQKGIFKGVAINIHKGGYNYTSSAGCQTIYPDQWQEFKTETDQALAKEGMKEFDYILIDYQG